MRGDPPRLPRNIVDWGAQFANMTKDEQRAVLSQLISRIEVSRNYEIMILFNVSLDEFFGENSDEEAAEISS